MAGRDVRPGQNDDDYAEVPEADVHEQQRDSTGDGSDADDIDGLPDGVDPADAHEQQLAVEYDEDDYR